MFSKTFFVAAIAAVFAGQAIAIASEPVSACNCPNNCDYVLGSSCKYYAGGSDQSEIIDGTCGNSPSGTLMCMA